MKKFIKLSKISSLLIIIFFSTIFSQKDDILQLGNKFLEEKLYSLAVKQYAKYLKAFPDSKDADQAVFKIASCYYELNQFSESEKYFEKFINKFPRHKLIPDAMFLQAKAFYNQRKYKRAAENYSKIYSEYSSYKNIKECMYMSGISYYKSRNFDKSAYWLERFANRFDKSKRAGLALAYLGEISITENEKNKAVNYYNKIIKEYRSDKNLLAQTYYKLAKIYEDMDNQVMAIKSYNSVINDHPDYSNIQKVLKEFADYLYQKEKYKKCAEIINLYIKKLEGSADEIYYFRHPSCLFLSGQHKKAIQEFETFLLKFPDSNKSSLVKFKIAQSHKALNKNEDAINTLDDLTQKHQNDKYGLKALKLMGDLYYKDKLFLNSVNIYRRYLKISDKSENRDNVAFRIAYIYESMFNKPAHAIKEYEKFIEDFPLSSLLDHAQYSKARCHEKLNEFDKALMEYERLIEYYPSSSFIKNAEERIEYIKNYKLSDYNEAIELLVNLNSKKFDPQEKLIKIADIYEFKLKNFNKAIDVLNRYEKEFPNSTNLASIGFRKGTLFEKISKKAYHESNKDLALEYKKRALGIFKDIIEKYPADTLVDDIKLKLLEAANAPIKEYIEFLKIYPNSNKQSYVSFKIAEYYYIKLKNNQNEKLMLKAVEMFRKAINTAGEKNDIIAGSFFKIGKCYLRMDRYEAAEIQFNKIINEFPLSRLAVESYFLLGQINFRTKSYDKAIEYYKKVLYKFPFSAYTEKCVLNTAKARYLKKDITGSIKQYRNFIASYPKSTYLPDAHLGLAKCYIYMDKNNNAISELIKINQNYSDYNAINKTRVMIADLYKKSNNNKKAADYYRKVVNDPDQKYASVYSSLAEVLYNLKNYKDASFYYVKSLKNSKDKKDSLNSMAGLINSLTIQGNIKRAKKLKAKFKDKYPDEIQYIAEMTFTEGLYLLKKGFYKKASKRFDYILNRYGNTNSAPASLYYYAVCLYQKKAFSEALQYFKDFLSNNKDTALEIMAKLKIASIYEHLEDPVNAAQFYKDVAVAKNINQKTLITASLKATSAFEKLSDWQSAFRIHKHYIKNIDSSSIRTSDYIKMGYLSTQVGDYKSALEYFSKASQIAEKNEMAEVTYWIAKSYAMTGKYEKAVVEFLKIPYLYKDSGMWSNTARLEAAAIYQKTGDINNAKKMYNKIISIDGENGRYGKVALKKLKDLKAISN